MSHFDNKYLLDKLLSGWLGLTGVALFGVGFTGYMAYRQYDFPLMGIGTLTTVYSLTETLRNRSNSNLASKLK